MIAFWHSAAEGYRPFDGTDAAVAETGEIEVEFGPVEYLRAGAERALLAPDLRINYGFTPGWEASLEGKITHGLTAGISGLSVVENDALIKGVLREGSLQEKPGPSIATEFGVLLPGINDEHGTGAALNGIASQRWDWGRSTSMCKLRLPVSSTPTTFLIRLLRVRTTGWYDPSPNSFMNGMLVCFGPVLLSSERSGRFRTI